MEIEQIERGDNQGVIDRAIDYTTPQLLAVDQLDDGPYRKAADNGLTALGDVMGTPSYMPPEQAQGAIVDERADIYALGAMLYKVLSGCSPFVGDESRSILEKVRAGAPVPIEERAPGVPVELAAVVRKPMAREFAGLWRYRVRVYRMICHIENDSLLVLVLRAERLV